MRNALFFIGFIVGMAYIFLGMIAYSHVGEDETWDKLHAASPWWALYKSKYDAFGQTLCDYGRRLIVIDMFILAMMWAVQVW